MREVVLKDSKIRSILKLMRPKHYIKNLLVIVPLTFGRALFYGSILLRGLSGFLAFSFLASVVYIINDIHDREADRNHEQKRSRPIASGVIRVKEGYILAVILLVAAIVLNHYCSIQRGKSLFFMGLYFSVNLGYSMGLKEIPFLDIVLLVSGFLIRVLYGAAIVDLVASSWLYLTITSLSFYLGLGKRRNELKKLSATDAVGSTRKVLASYSYAFLDKFMYVCLTLSVAFYALWSADSAIVARYGTDKLVWTVPLVLILLMKYTADIETDSYGDPVDVITHDKVLLVISGLFGLIMLLLIYQPFAV